jgi:isoprenylcysteine carboxyl methyltransferase (ICMT) family protein YpbQ
MNPLLLTLYILASVWRLGSLAVSRRHEKALKARGAREYGQGTSRLLALAHTVFYVGAFAEGLWRRTQPTLWTAGGVLLYGLAVLVLLVVWRELQGLWTVKLLIASDHTLNQSALFRWVRHPNYFLNILPELVGLALMMGAWLILVLGLPLYLLVLRARIVQEEQVMRQHFPAYATVPGPLRSPDTPHEHPSA